MAEAIIKTEYQMKLERILRKANLMAQQGGFKFSDFFDYLPESRVINEDKNNDLLKEKFFLNQEWWKAIGNIKGWNNDETQNDFRVLTFGEIIERHWRTKAMRFMEIAFKPKYNIYNAIEYLGSIID